MAINWDEIRRKGQEKGAAAEAQVQFKRAVPSLPKAQPLPKALPRPSGFRNATNQTTISAEQQKKNQATALQELQGKDGNIASFARGASLAMLDPFSLRKVTRDNVSQMEDGRLKTFLDTVGKTGVYGIAEKAKNPAQEQASAQNTFDFSLIKNPRIVAQGLRPVETTNGRKTFEGLGELAGSMVGVDPVGIGITKGIQKGVQIAKGLKAVEKIPVLVNGKVSFVDTPTLPRATTPAPQPRALPVVAKNAPVKNVKAQPDIPVRATESTAQPTLPQKGTEIPKERPFAKTGDLLKRDETYKKALMQTALDEYDRTVVSITDYISNYKPKGVDVGVIPKNGDELMRDGGIRYAASKNDEWYQDFYRANGRKPNKTEVRELAERLVKDSLRRKSGEFYNEDLGKVLGELNGLKKDLGADTFKGEKSIDELVNEFGAFPKGEMPRAREVDIPKKTDYGQTQRYARTLQESAIVDDTLFKDINEAITQGSFTKPTKGNKTAVEDASRTITDEGLDEAAAKFKSVIMSDKRPTSYDIALGNRTLQELQNAGRYDEALDVAIDLSEILSESGRTLQAARIAKRLSPEGRLMIASRVANKVAKKTGKKVKLSDDTIKLISEAKTEKEVVEANHKAAVEIWNQAPASWIDKVNSWRYMSMLFNPKTHARNIVGNSIFVPAREFKNLIGTGLERALIKDGIRTKAVLNPLKDKAIMDFASADFQNVKAILKNEGKLDDNVRNLDAKVFNFKPLEGVRRLNLNALDAEDTWFMKFAYDSSLAQYMKANKLTPENMIGETLEAGRKYAMNESLKATYRDFNALANIISRGKHTLASGKYGTLGKAGGVALEGLIPFTKTPLNIVKRGVGYSPANIVRGIANLGQVKSGKVTATEAIDQLASGLSGTALLGLGTFLGYNNIVNGKEGEYKDKLYNYNQMLGSQNYSLNIDGKSYTLDWAAPLSMPFFVGVEISNAIKDNNADLATVLDAMTQISDPMVNLSMLKGINDIMTNSFEGIGQTAFDIGTGYAGQFNPTVLGQISRTADPSRRSTISTAETGTLRGIEKFGRKQLAKIPFASKNLEPYVDLWGREQKNGNFAENFLSPGYFKSENVTKVDEELKSLVGKLDKETADKILPTSKAYQYTIQSAGLPYRMTEKESTAYQKTRGQESYKGLNKLFASIDYRKMSQDEKVKAIQDVYSEAHDKAKYDYFDSKGLPVTLALDKGYQEKYKTVKAYVSDKQFYSAVQSVKGKSTNIEKAYALAGKPDKVLEVFGIDTQAKEGYVPIMQKIDELRQSGIAAKDYIEAKQAADMNASGNISKAEATGYLDARSDLTSEQKAAILQALVPALKPQNNPYY
jgi:hypothetical protein